MTKELIWFEKLISSDLKDLNQTEISPALREHYSARIHLELQNSKKEIFNDIAIKKYPKPKAQNKIWEYQKTITRLMDLLFAQNPEYWCNISIQDDDSLQLSIHKGLLDLRAFLLNYFPRCCNDLEKQSIIDYTFLSRDISKAISVLQERFMPYTKERLFQTMISPLTGFITKKQKAVTLNQAIYLEAYKDHLLELNVGVNKTSFFEDCEKSIFRYNLNSPRVFRYFTSSLQEKLNSQGTITMKIRLLLYEQHKVKQFYSKPTLKYREDLPNLKYHLCEWIQDETEHLQRQAEINSKIDAAIRTDEADFEVTKLPTNFSVPELSILLRLLNEIGGIKSNSISATTKWASECLESKKAKSISSDSLRAKYYEPSSTSIVQMEKYLKQMLNLIKEMN